MLTHRLTAFLWMKRSYTIFIPMTVIPVSFANIATHPKTPDAIIPAFSTPPEPARLWIVVELDLAASLLLRRPPTLIPDEVEESVKDSSESDKITPPFPHLSGDDTHILRRLWGNKDLK